MSRIIGAHVSAAGGIDKAAQRANAIGCNAVQIFTSSPRTWQPANPDNFHHHRYVQACEQLDIHTTVIHAIYLINLASDKPEQVQKSVNVLSADLKIAALLNATGVVVHLGSHQGRGYEAMKQGMVDTIIELLENTPDTARLLIENSAGQNGKLSSDLAEIKDLITSVKSPRLGWCLDTCHSHAAGYPLFANSKAVPADGKPLKPAILDEAERLGLLPNLKCIHVNDSRDPFDSGRDRHANLGEGMIDQVDFKAFVNDPRITSLPLIMEVPGADNQGPDLNNVNILKSWIGENPV